MLDKLNSLTESNITNDNDYIKFLAFLSILIIDHKNNHVVEIYNLVKNSKENFENHVETSITNNALLLAVEKKETELIDKYINEEKDDYSQFTTLKNISEITENKSKSVNLYIAPEIKSLLQYYLFIYLTCDGKSYCSISYAGEKICYIYFSHGKLKSLTNQDLIDKYDITFESVVNYNFMKSKEFTSYMKLCNIHYNKSIDCCIDINPVKNIAHYKTHKTVLYQKFDHVYVQALINLPNKNKQQQSAYYELVHMIMKCIWKLSKLGLLILPKDIKYIASDGIIVAYSSMFGSTSKTSNCTNLTVNENSLDIVFRRSLLVNNVTMCIKDENFNHLKDIISYYAQKIRVAS
jgi:hypothetical protein